MITQYTILDMIPGIGKPTVNVSQYDTGARTLVFQLRERGKIFTPPAGTVAKIHGIKPDSTYFAYVAEVDGDAVIADCKEQMTPLAGLVTCEIVLTDSDGKVGSCNFILNVEKSPETGAIISDTDIPVFEQLATRAEQAASSATASATAASEKATQAGESATNAANSASAAAGSASDASNSAAAALVSERAAAESARTLTIDPTLTQSGQVAEAKATGDAVTELRGQIDAYQERPYLYWVIGQNISGTGVVQNNGSMARTRRFEVSPGDIIVRTTPAKDSNNQNLLVYINTYSKEVWQARTQLYEGDRFTVPSGIDGVIIGYGRAGSAGVTMTQEDVDTYFSMVMYGSDQYIKKFYALTGTSFADITKQGIYNVNQSAVESMSDAPTDSFGGGTFVVLPAGSDPLSCIQILFDSTNQKSYNRQIVWNASTLSYNNPTPWVMFDYVAPTINELSSVATALSANTKIGLYRVGSYAQSPTSSYTDMPIDNFGGGYLIVYPAGGNNGIAQVLVDVVNGYTWHRYISGVTLQNVGEWNSDLDIKWAAIGDSITYGVYSTGSNTTAVNRNTCYVKRIANRIHAKLDNLGVRGLGFVHTGNNLETLKDDVIDATTWTYYNLVTVALGINDYYGVSDIGTQASTAWDGTVYGNIRGTIESIMAANPAIKLIFITPFNMSKYGDASTHWGRNYSRNHIGTLNDVKTAIIYWCDYYGVEYINETDYSVINDINITSLLLDGLHPSSTAHKLIAKELAKKINFS